MDTLQITLTDKRVIDGFIVAANREGVDVLAYAHGLAAGTGLKFADENNVGILTAAAFIARLTPAEYGQILLFSQQNPESQVAAIVNELLGSTFISLGDQRLIPYLEALVSEALLEEHRIEELAQYERPEPEWVDDSPAA